MPLKKRIQPHIRLGEGDVAKIVFIAGNPDRIPKIAAKVGLDQNIQNKAIRLLYEAKKKQVITGKDPAGIAAAA